MSAPLRRVLVRRPALAGDWAGAAWRTPDPARLAAQHEAFCALLAGLGPEVEVAAALETMLRSRGAEEILSSLEPRRAKPSRNGHAKRKKARR